MATRDRAEDSSASSGGNNGRLLHSEESYSRSEWSMSATSHGDPPVAPGPSEDVSPQAPLTHGYTEPQPVTASAQQPHADSMHGGGALARAGPASAAERESLLNRNSYDRVGRVNQQVPPTSMDRWRGGRSAFDTGPEQPSPQHNGQQQVPQELVPHRQQFRVDEGQLRRRATETFDTLDANRSGTLDRSVAVDALNRLGARCDTTSVESLLQEVGAYAEGQINFQQFVALCVRLWKRGEIDEKTI